MVYEYWTWFTSTSSTMSAKAGSSSSSTHAKLLKHNDLFLDVPKNKVKTILTIVLIVLTLFYLFLISHIWLEQILFLI